MESSDRQIFEAIKGIQTHFGEKISPHEIKLIALLIFRILLDAGKNDFPVLVTKSETGLRFKIVGANTGTTLSVPWPQNLTTVHGCKTEWDAELTTQIETAASRILPNLSLEDFFRVAKIDIDKKQTL